MNVQGCPRTFINDILNDEGATSVRSRCVHFMLNYITDMPCTYNATNVSRLKSLSANAYNDLFENNALYRENWILQLTSDTHSGQVLSLGMVKLSLILINLLF